MGREFELKYQADPRILAAIREQYGVFFEICMETSYFDTPDRDLHRRRWTLRRRMENGVCVCTVKTLLPDGSRGEWETKEDDLLSAIPVLCKLGAPEELSRLAAAGLEQTCAAKFVRLAAGLPAGESTVELALDQGVLIGGGRELPFWEVEVELKSGADGDALAFAQALAREFHLIPQPKSKVQRAMALADTGKENYIT